MKATEQYFPVGLFIMLYKMVLTFQSVDEILQCDHSNESCWHYFCVVRFVSHPFPGVNISDYLKINVNEN